MVSRRKWLRHSLATVVGTALWAPNELRAWQAHEHKLTDQLAPATNTEAYWELVTNCLKSARPFPIWEKQKAHFE
jgi:hypothetical protein